MSLKKEEKVHKIGLEHLKNKIKRNEWLVESYGDVELGEDKKLTIDVGKT